MVMRLAEVKHGLMRTGTAPGMFCMAGKKWQGGKILTRRDLAEESCASILASLRCLSHTSALLKGSCLDGLEPMFPLRLHSPLMHLRSIEVHARIQFDVPKPWTQETCELSFRPAK